MTFRTQVSPKVECKGKRQFVEPLCNALSIIDFFIYTNIIHSFKSGEIENDTNSTSLKPKMMNL